LGRPALADAPVELAETKVAVGGERAHAELVGPGEGLAVMSLRRLQIGRVGVGGDLAEEAQDPGLVATLLLLVREVEGAPGDRERVVPAAGQEMRLPEASASSMRRTPSGRRPDSAYA
jgi:hypothetical protein